MPIPRALIDQTDCRKLHHNLHRSLAAGFVLLIVLMIVLTANAVLHMSELENRMRDIVELRNQKIQLASELIEASHQRHDALVYQVVTEDAFDRDEHFQLFIRAGYQVGKLRNELRALPLDEAERENFAQQDALIQEITVLHDEISNLAAQGRLAEAQHLLATELRPLNRQFVALINQLRHDVGRANRESLTLTHDATSEAIGLTLVLSGVVILLAIVIAVIAIRQLRMHARTIDAQLRALEEAGIELEHEATHDALTGLANRTLFYRRLQQAIVHAREEKLKAAVLYIDLDDFKPVNDTYGHAVGDALLQVVTGRILKHVRTTDTVARLGGDEFAVVLLGIGEVELIERIKANIIANIRQPAHISGYELLPGCSVGHAIYPDDGEAMDALLHAADVRMYEAKRARKNGAAREPADDAQPLAAAPTSTHSGEG